MLVLKLRDLLVKIASRLRCLEDISIMDSLTSHFADSRKREPTSAMENLSTASSSAEILLEQISSFWRSKSRLSVHPHRLEQY
jgi:hypothetical protein